MREAHRENRALWQAWSDEFQALWRADTEEGERPPAPLVGSETLSEEDETALFDGFRDADVVDLGCGGGQHSVAFAREGARTVTGVDLATRQLEHARELAEEYGVAPRFVAGDATALPLADDAFDVAFSSGALQLVADLEACFREVRRVLRPGGVFVAEFIHPFYELFDAETHELERSYHADPERRVTIDEGYDAELVVFDRSIATLFNAFVDAGFRVERLVEPGSDDPADYHDGALASDRPDLKALVPRSVLFRAVRE